MRPVLNLRTLVLILATLLAACVSMEAPKNFNERLAYAFAGVSAARATATAMLERGRITVQEARDAQGMADQSRAALELSRGAWTSGDATTAEGQLQLGLTVLTALESYLRGKENP